MRRSRAACDFAAASSCADCSAACTFCTSARFAVSLPLARWTSCHVGYSVAFAGAAVRTGATSAPTTTAAATSTPREGVKTHVGRLPRFTHGPASRAADSLRTGKVHRVRGLVPRTSHTTLRRPGTELVIGGGSRAGTVSRVLLLLARHASGTIGAHAPSSAVAMACRKHIKEAPFWRVPRSSSPKPSSTTASTASAPSGSRPVGSHSRPRARSPRTWTRKRCSSRPPAPASTRVRASTSSR